MTHEQTHVVVVIPAAQHRPQHVFGRAVEGVGLTRAEGLLQPFHTRVQVTGPTLDQSVGEKRDQRPRGEFAFVLGELQLRRQVDPEHRRVLRLQVRHGTT